jgi:hypothetical protein
VAELVGGSVAESGGAGELLEFASKVGGVDECAVVGAEDEVVLVSCVADGETLGVLTGTVATQC